MCESCQKGRLQVGKLGCCTFKKWRELTCPFYVFTKNKFKFGISRFFDHFTATSLVGFICYRFFFRRKNLIASKVRKNMAFTRRLYFQKNGGYVLVLSSHVKDFKYLLNVDIQIFIYSSQIVLQIFHNFEKNSLLCLVVKSQ